MTNDISKSNSFSLSANSLDQAMQYAKLIADSDLAPKDYKGKPGNVLVAVEMGKEVGLSPMQAIQNIAVINGRPSIWGDAAIGLVRAHKHCESIREWLEGNLKDGTLTAFCGSKRKGQDEEIRSFSIDQAKKAGLWGKPGPWSQYPERMLQMRARGFCLRDVFADALKGLHIAEEAQDLPHAEYSLVNDKPKASNVNARLGFEAVNETIIDTTKVETPEEIKLSAEDYISRIKNAGTLEELKEIYGQAFKDYKGTDEMQDINEEKDFRKITIEAAFSVLDDKA